MAKNAYKQQGGMETIPHSFKQAFHFCASEITTDGWGQNITETYRVVSLQKATIYRYVASDGSMFGRVDKPSL